MPPAPNFPYSLPRVNPARFGALLLAGATITAGWHVNARGQQPAPVTAKVPGIVSSPSAPVLWPVYTAAQSAFRRRDYAELDALAELVTKDHTLDRDGRADLEDFFKAFTNEKPKRPDGWPAYLERFDAWIAAAPDSPSARVAKAEALTAYAWLARGHGYADSVTEEGWRLFRERVSQARTVLEAGRPLAPRCPHWYVVMLTVARAQSWTREQAAALAHEGIAQAPWYHPTYHQTVMFLLPRWHGQPGDWQTFARDAAASLGPEEGAYLYACLISRVLVTGEEMFLTSPPVDWPMAARGFEELIRRYPEPHLRKLFCQLSCLAGDRSKAREAFAQVSFDADFHPWNTEGEVVAWRAWAEGGPLPAPRARQQEVFDLLQQARQRHENAQHPDL